MVSFFAPERSRNGHGRPTYGLGWVLPSLYVRLLEEKPGWVELSAHLHVSGSRFQPFHSEVPIDELPEAFSRYAATPEEFLLDYFDYRVPDKTEPKAKLSLEDLGL